MKESNVRYFDGVAMQAQTVEITLSNDTLIIQTTDLTVEWPVAELKILDLPHEGKPCIIGCIAQQGARLLVTDAAFYAQLIERIPDQHIQKSHVHHHWRHLLMFSAIAVVLLGLAVWSVPFFAPTIARNIPHSWDDALGKFTIEQITAGYQECTDPKGRAALNVMIAKLTQHQNLERPFDIKVVDMDDFNAFAVSGFHLVIMKGLIDTAKNSDEVAGVMAHEMAHSIQHHPTAGLITDLGIRIIIGSAIGNFPDAGIALLNFRYSREKEYEADKIGVKLLNEANLSAEGLAGFFETIIKHVGDEPKFLEYISTHPSTSDRIERVRQMDEIKSAASVLNAQQWQDLRNICRQKRKIEFEQ